MSPVFDLAIAGAGIMGLACAWEEARRGKSVGVFDPSVSAAQASFAAAGILVTRDARFFASPFREFYVRSIRQYPEWLAGISAVPGAEVSLHRGGDHLIFDLDDAFAREKMEAKERQLEREHSHDFTIADALPEFLKGHCPAVNVRVFHFPGEAYVQNRDLLAALRLACETAGVVFRIGSPTLPWEHSGGSTRIRFDDGEWEARKVLIAAGAWSAGLLGSLGIAAPMVVVKGQLARIPKFHGTDGMIHFNDDFYLVPRGEWLVAGATTEPGVRSEGFDEA